jgi:hypothetical protein
MRGNHNLFMRLLSLANVWHVFRAMPCIVLICYGNDSKAPGLIGRGLLTVPLRELGVLSKFYEASGRYRTCSGRVYQPQDKWRETRPGSSYFSDVDTGTCWKCLFSV